MIIFYPIQNINKLFIVNEKNGDYTTQLENYIKNGNAFLTIFIIP